MSRYFLPWLILACKLLERGDEQDACGLACLMVDPEGVLGTAARTSCLWGRLSQCMGASLYLPRPIADTGFDLKPDFSFVAILGYGRLE